MDAEIIKNELEKLNTDKKNIDTRLNQLKEELVVLEKNRDVISGAIQTCNYFLKIINDSDNESVSEENDIDE
jgi:hypothetical protein